MSPDEIANILNRLANRILLRANALTACPISAEAVIHLLAIELREMAREVSQS